ncbi:MAG: ATP-binding cassette domain-containing protein [Terracidiphilus sp.]
MLELSLDARRGSFHLQVDCRFASDWTVIFGPSGAGKSTLLRLLAGLDLSAPRRPQHARIALDGRLFTDTSSGLWLKPGHRQTSMVAQQSALFPHLSVAANVAYGLHDLDRSSRNSRVEEMLELVDAATLIDRRPRHLSGGEAQRVALARALAPKPRLLLLDEPLSALDGAASDALLVRLQEWASEHGVQTVLATHDATDALATGAEVALLHEGRLAALGPAAEVLANERSRLIHRLSTNLSS